MFKTIVFVVVAAIAATISYTEWTPDPFCPYPSDEITKFQYYGNCSVYWACYQGSKFIVECPDGQEFDVVTSDCAPLDVAQCDPDMSTTTTTQSTGSTDSSSVSTTTDDSSSVSTTTVSSTTNGNDPHCPPDSEEAIYIPYNGDCSKYWECFEGDAYLYSCPDGLWWHQEITQCDYPGDYCDGSTSTSPTSTVTTETTDSSTGSTQSTDSTTPNPDDITCPDPNDTPVYFPVPGDCSHYWECFAGNKILNSCPSGQWWHQEEAKCDEPGDYCTNSLFAF